MSGKFSYDEKKKEIVESIRMLTLAGGKPPLLQQLAFVAGVSVSTLQGVLKRMRADGLVDWVPGAPQSLVLLTTTGGDDERE